MNFQAMGSSLPITALYFLTNMESRNFAKPQCERQWLTHPILSARCSVQGLWVKAFWARFSRFLVLDTDAFGFGFGFDETLWAESLGFWITDSA